MRIALSLVIIADLVIRAQDLTAFFTDDGLWPTRLIPNFGWQSGYWSLHTLSGSYAFECVLFAFHFIAAFCLLIGYKTKLSTFVVWALTISLHNRNLFILQSGDDLLRLTLFWAMFMPWGNAYSIDAKRYQTKKHHFSVASIGYLVLIASVYFFTICFKNSSEWRTEGTALYYALSLDQIRLPLGDWLYQFPNLMKWLTHLAFYMEVLIPVLILFPTKKPWVKLSAIAIIFVLHLSIGITMYVGLFYLIDLSTSLAMLPTSFIDKYRSLAISNVNKVKRVKLKLISNLKTAFLSFVLILCLILNFSYMTWFSYELTGSMNAIINVLRLNQYWGMFSPHIMKEDGWYVYEGYTDKGKHWDLYNNTPFIKAEKPEHLVKHYKSDRWRKLAENIQRNEYTFLKPLYCKYYLNKWNKEHPENKMRSLDLIFFLEVSDANYKVKPLERKQFCFCVTDDQ